MVKSKQNTKKAVFIAALLLSVLASALAPVFMQGEEAQGRFKWNGRNASTDTQTTTSGDRELPPIEKGPEDTGGPIVLPDLPPTAPIPKK